MVHVDLDRIVLGAVKLFGDFRAVGKNDSWATTARRVAILFAHDHSHTNRAISRALGLDAQPVRYNLRAARRLFGQSLAFRVLFRLLGDEVGQ